METNERRHEDLALREALSRMDEQVMLPEDFEQRVLKRVPRRGKNYLVAAVLVGVLMLSGIAWAAWEYRGQVSDSAPVESMTCPSDSQPVATEGNIVYFDNVRLDSVLGVVALHYQKQVDFRTDGLRSLHFHIEWNQTAPLSDFITLINNFEGITLREEQDTIIAE